jgi:hypothetical protein
MINNSKQTQSFSKFFCPNSNLFKAEKIAFDSIRVRFVFDPYSISNRSGFVTYANDDEIQTSPCAGEVPPEAECNPLEDHFDGEQDGEDHVHDLQDEH